MKRLVTTFLIAIAFSPMITKCQTDSVEIFKLNDNYVEIKSLRKALYVDSFSMTPTLSLFTNNFIPKPAKLKNGVVLIRNNNGQLIELYIFSDSTIINEDHYNKNGQLTRQISSHSKDIEIEKYYWHNGNLQSLIIYQNRKQIIYDYTENGQYKLP